MPMRRLAMAIVGLFSLTDVSLNTGSHRGKKIQQSSRPQSRKGHEGTQARHTQERRLGPKGQESKTGDRHRFVRGTQGWKESTEEEASAQQIAWFGALLTRGSGTADYAVTGIPSPCSAGSSSSIFRTEPLS
jgi:hypothetical protein